ncbi:MAG: MotA/TolQ/ExbB proton channel family protein [Ekhidna sp.]|nr:MotA/TolQ/ExbB proton channel family protein [Ekhidna sp.]MBC6410798.1 MotA/TolQ/ExbB proton channel family protein [Ekhidna sp.]MBC6427578.1 MotA/TolQ/ExbB proton channel family protein [Ekhidna sp.]
MKKLLTLFMLTGVIAVSASAQNASFDNPDSLTVDSAVVDAAVGEEVAAADPAKESEEIYIAEESSDSRNFHQVVKQYFIDGDATFMTFPLLCLILGLAIAIERIIHLNMASTNTKKLLSGVEDALKSGGVNAAKKVCRNTRGPVASIFVQGLMRMSEGIEMVEKSIISYGSVEMGKLEKGMIWISLFIALAPMLGFMGTVIGMIAAFDAIAEAGDVSPALVASGIKVALLTTVAGLIVAVILQLFYNYLVSKVDSIVNSMEDASISLVDFLVKHNLSKSK